MDQLIFPSLGPVYDALSPWAHALLRVWVGFALVPHGLRLTFGLFPNSGAKSLSLRQFAPGLEKRGFKPGIFWATSIACIELGCGPLLAIGLLTRLMAIPIVIFLVTAGMTSALERRYFWNKEGCEYPFLWAIAALFFLITGGGIISVDHLLGFQF